jgi:hypothetical protein
MSWDESPMNEEVIPGHILNLMCAIHLRQDHGYKRWTVARFNGTFQDSAPETEASDSPPSTSCTTPGSAALC